MNTIDTTFIDGAASEGLAAPRAPDGFTPHHSQARGESRERTSLHLEATGTRVRTEVMRRTAERITVTQALPFLKLKSGVRDADGRAARIEWVSVDIEGDTPALVMEIVYDEPPREDETEQLLCLEGAMPKRRDETVPYTFERAEARLEVAIAGASLAPRPAARLVPRRPSFWEAIGDVLSEIAAEITRAARMLGRLLAMAITGG